MSALYSQLARARRRRYARGAEPRRRLDRPVISVGNLRAGGSGKTPLVAHLATLLLAAGERPAILSRGYGRAEPDDGVVVVSDGSRVLADLGRAGDEPLMLARALPGVRVLVCGDRHLAGRVAEVGLDCTVHVLDDGFQHLGLARDVDLVVIEPGDVDAPRVLPLGRLRESLDAVREADALVVPADTTAEAAAVGERLGVTHAFQLVRRPGTLVWEGDPIVNRQSSIVNRVVAVAGIARPERFVADLRASGCDIVAEMRFRDHHRFGPRDVAAIARRVRETGADGIVTTAKDLLRLRPLRPWPFAVAWLPLDVAVEPDGVFGIWLQGRLEQARRRRDPAA